LVQNNFYCKQIVYVLAQKFWDKAKQFDLVCKLSYTVRTEAADLRRGEHIPKMQNNIGHKSTLLVLRQLRSKDGGGWVPYRAVPCRAAPRGARPVAGLCTTAVDLRWIGFGGGSGKNTTMGSILLPPDF
jgi:hypothetical protein